MVKDWLGETRIERDSYGAPVCITDHKGRSVHYEWGGMGQRQGMEAKYFYNALDHRTGRSTGGEMEEYLLDLTKPYHNLLELRKGKHRQTFYWDMNVSAMEDENKIIQYYLSDELGSPLRVLHRNGNGDAYGYDEFGIDLYGPGEERYSNKKYSRQGEHQPFGYTGYRYDDISGTYFAQAREYQPEVGRFVAEDVIRGRNTVPKTLNRYGYCWGESNTICRLERGRSYNTRRNKR